MEERIDVVHAKCRTQLTKVSIRSDAGRLLYYWCPNCRHDVPSWEALKRLFKWQKERTRERI